MRMKQSFFMAVITACLLLSTMVFAQDVVVNKVGTPITIDGTIDAVWQNVTPNYVEYVVVESVDDEYDLYGEWKALWDDNNFYMLVEVTDDELYDDSDGVDEHDDGFDIMFDTDNGDEDSPDVDDNDDFKDVIEDIQSYGVEVFFSIGGDSNAGNLKTIASDEDLIDDFVENVIDLVNE